VGSPSTSSTGASTFAYLLALLLGELIQLAINHIREDSNHLADWIPQFALSQVTGEPITQEGYGPKGRGEVANLT